MGRCLFYFGLDPKILLNQNYKVITDQVDNLKRDKEKRVIDGVDRGIM